MQRRAWLLLLAFIIVFEACALFFQHVMMLAPCVMCIYERVAMLGIGPPYTGKPILACVFVKS